MRVTADRTRSGFTLIELLVVMAIIATLAAMAMLIAPQALERDRSAEAVNTLTGAMQIARSRAMRDGIPRGIRLIPNNGAFASEFQPIEAPPAFVPNPNGPLWTGNAPYVQFDYTISGTGGVISNGRVCTVYGLTVDQRLQIESAVNISASAVGATRTILVLPTLGTSHGVIGYSAGPGGSLRLSLQDYPDGNLGGQIHWRTYHFGFYSPPRALLGEPVSQLPRNTAVDLARSWPAGTAGTDYDILFAPNGQLLSTSATRDVGQVFLMIRDPNRPAPVPGNAAANGAAGEVMILGIKSKTGGIGAAPMDWGADPFSLARKAAFIQ